MGASRCNHIAVERENALVGSNVSLALDRVLSGGLPDWHDGGAGDSQSAAKIAKCSFRTQLELDYGLQGCWGV